MINDSPVDTAQSLYGLAMDINILIEDIKIRPCMEGFKGAKCEKLSFQRQNMTRRHRLLDLALH